MSDNKAISHVAKRIRRGQAVLFLGAGVSYFSPTDLPSGIELKNSILDIICSSDSLLRDSLTGPYRDDARFAGRVDRLSPERVFSALYEVVADELYTLFGAFHSGTQNPHHRFLADCMRRGWVTTLLTTNFDRHIEVAARKSMKTPLTVVSADQEFARPQRGPTLYKLHGSTEAPASIMTTLSQTGRYFSGPKRQLLKTILESHTVIFVGYSGYDFDVMTVVLSSRLKDVYWIVRPGSDPFQAPLLSLLKGHPKCRFIQYDLNEWFYDLGRQLGVLQPGDVSAPTHNLNRDFQSILNRATARFRGYQRMLMIAKVLIELWEYEKAIACCERLLASTAPTAGPLERAGSHLTMATAYRRMHQMKESWEQFDKAFKIFEKQEEHRLLISTSLEIATIWEMAGEHDIAMKYYATAGVGFGLFSEFELIEDWELQPGRVPEPELVRSLLGLARVAWAQGNREAGYSVTMRAMSAAEQTGDLALLLSAKLQLADMHLAKQEYATATAQYEEALKFAYVIGDCFGVQSIASWLSKAYLRANDPGKAGRVLAEAHNYLSLWDFSDAVFNRPWFLKRPRIESIVETFFGIP